VTARYQLILFAKLNYSNQSFHPLIRKIMATFHHSAPFHRLHLNTLYSVHTVYTSQASYQSFNDKAKGGPDDIPPVFFRHFFNQLASPVTFVFNNCIEYNYIPPVWLRAYITPIYKRVPQLIHKTIAQLL